ncbi:hypothetical protein ACFE04_011464 [Oxalis oulophora]
MEPSTFFVKHRAFKKREKLASDSMLPYAIESRTMSMHTDDLLPLLEKELGSYPLLQFSFPLHLFSLPLQVTHPRLHSTVHRVSSLEAGARLVEGNRNEDTERDNPSCQYALSGNLALSKQNSSTL